LLKHTEDFFAAVVAKGGPPMAIVGIRNDECPNSWPDMQLEDAGLLGPTAGL